MHCSFSPSLEYLPPLHSCNMEYEGGGKDIWWVAEVLWFAYFRAEELRQGPSWPAALHDGREGAALSSAVWWLQQDSREWHGAVSGEGQLKVRKWFFSRELWAWKRLPRAVGTAPSWWSSRGVWTLLSDMGFEFWVVLYGDGSWTQLYLWVLSNLAYSMTLWFSRDMIFVDCSIWIFFYSLLV